MRYGLEIFGSLEQQNMTDMYDISAKNSNQAEVICISKFYNNIYRAINHR